jgi:putative addiction module component (TIGR02574 family)
MSPTGQRLLEEALALPAQERADLAGTLLESLDQGEDEAVEDAWSEEIERRVEDVESGKVKTVPWSEARSRILAARDARKLP